MNRNIKNRLATFSSVTQESAVSYFSEGLSLEFAKDKGNHVIKEGLLFYASDGNNPHIDSKGNAWTVTGDQLKQIARNTNERLKTRVINVYKEHQTNVDNLIGELKGVYTKIIGKEEIARNPAWSELEGRVGLFAKEVVIKDRTLAQKVKDKVAKFVSCGINFSKNIMTELSLVAEPALVHSALFKAHKEDEVNPEQVQKDINSQALTFDDAMSKAANKESNRTKLNNLSEIFLNILENIDNVSSEHYGLNSKDQLLNKALTDYVEYIKKDLSYFPKNKEITNAGVKVDSNTNSIYSILREDSSTFNKSSSILGRLGERNFMSSKSIKSKLGTSNFMSAKSVRSKLRKNLSV